jgi:hypothetical protein
LILLTLNPECLIFRAVTTNSNAVDIPIDTLEEAFIQAAVPGFFGSVTAEVCVRPTAGLEVELRIRKRVVEQCGSSKEQVPVVPSNHRVDKVRIKLRDFARRFTLSTPIVSVKGNFADGELKTFEVEELKT